MFDYYRLLLLAIIKLYLKIVHTSPNQASELGTREGDEITKGGDVRYQTFLSLIRDLLLDFLILRHLFMYGNIPVSQLEQILFSLMSIGFLLRVWSYYSLGYYFTFNIGLRKDHKLIKTGPYRWLVHPSYTGQLLCVIPTLSLLNVPALTSICYFFYIYWSAKNRIKIEEEVLTEKFGDEYRDFIKKRYRYIPFLY